MISPYCRRREAICNMTSPYRTIDGSCNNLNNPLWGRSNRPHRRFLKSVYMDGKTGPIKKLCLVFQVFGKKYKFMHFERRYALHKITFFPENYMCAYPA